ncbi:hypothetical protein ACIQ57_08695 [Lysinibacillus xylanilyticus]|uniref:hypothetical protein n=1 Tax=Lysinibacillus xylanilyticus TaxID=582475 RepID=UPI00382C1AD4
MSNEGRKNKPVSFNITEQHELALLKHAEKITPLTEKGNFSKFVKRLIEEDMKRGSGNEIRIDRNEPIMHEEESYSIETKEAMNSFI